MNSETPPPRVLLVDDEVDFLDNLHQRLELRGMPALKASSGAEALATLENEDVDVVVLDVRMPGMDGIETLRRIKEDHPRIEVVMLTGHADLESSLEGMRFGFYDYLTKPVQIETLVSKIHDAHERRDETGSTTARPSGASSNNIWSWPTGSRRSASWLGASLTKSTTRWQSSLSRRAGSERASVVPATFPSSW